MIVVIERYFLRSNYEIEQPRPNNSLELTPVGGERFSFSCHAGCLRSRKMNRASRSQVEARSLARMQLNSIR
jgi:hypothetical protein